MSVTFFKSIVVSRSFQFKLIFFQAVDVMCKDLLTIFVIKIQENVLVKKILLDTFVTRVHQAGGISQTLRVRSIFNKLEHSI